MIAPLLQLLLFLIFIEGKGGTGLRRLSRAFFVAWVLPIRAAVLVIFGHHIIF